MYVYGQLLRAAVETLGSDPSTAADKFTGRLWYNTATDLLKYADTAGGIHQVVGHDVVQTLTNKTIDADSNTLSNIENADIKAAAAIAVNKLAALTVSRAVVSDGSGFVSAATTTSAEIGYVNGVTSAIQTQLDAKQLRSTLTAKGDLYVATASNTVARQAVGTNDYVLTADSAQTNGIKWAAAPAQDSGYELTNLALASSVAGNALTIALKGKDGADPAAGNAVKIAFRNATLTTGTYSQISVTAATSLVISSGSTLGHRDATASYIYIYAINNAGTVELAASSKLFDEATVVSTTAEGGAGAADAWATIYSTTARSSVAFRLIGRLKSTQTTAGTWAVVPTETSVSPTPVLNIKNRFARAYLKTSNITSTAGASLEVIFNTAGNDYFSNYSTSNGRYTAVEAGQYIVFYGLNGTMGATAATSWQVDVRTNGAGDQRGIWSSDSFANSKSYKAVGHCIVDLAVGDYVSVFSSAVDQNITLTASGSDNDQCYFYIYKLGLA